MSQAQVTRWGKVKGEIQHGVCGGVIKVFIHILIFLFLANTVNAHTSLSCPKGKHGHMTWFNLRNVRGNGMGYLWVRDLRAST